MPFLALFLLLFDRRTAPNGAPSERDKVARWESATVDTAADSYGVPAKQMQQIKQMHLFTVHAREPIDAVCRAKHRAFIAALGRFDMISGVYPTLLHPRLATVLTRWSHGHNLGRIPNNISSTEQPQCRPSVVGRSWLPSIRRGETEVRDSFICQRPTRRQERKYDVLRLTTMFTNNLFLNSFFYFFSCFHDPPPSLLPLYLI